MKLLLGGLPTPVPRNAQVLRLALLVPLTILLGLLGIPLAVVAFALVFSPLALFGADLGFSAAQILDAIGVMVEALWNDLVAYGRLVLLVPALVAAAVMTYRAGLAGVSRWSYAAGPAWFFAAFAVAGIGAAIGAWQAGRSDAIDEIVLTPLYYTLGIIVGGWLVVRAARRDDLALRMSVPGGSIPATPEPEPM